MKASELRIGNWIKKDGGALWQVSGVFAGNDVVMVVADDVHFTLPASEFQPIHITEEWLKKFRFKKSGDAYHKSLFPKTWGFLAIELLDFSWSIDKHEGDNTVPSDSIRYVHSLQNLYFALTGEELNEIKKPVTV